MGREAGRELAVEHDGPAGAEMPTGRPSSGCGRETIARSASATLTSATWSARGTSATPRASRCTVASTRTYVLLR